MAYVPTIGLEIHAELKTKSRMFCDTPNGRGLEKEPNVNICPVCTGQPGTLPVINEEAVHMVLKTGLALDAEIQDFSKFDRKNYFYPDLPKGYQISQYDKPLVLGGHLEIDGKKIRIRRVHLEEDTGKLVHPKGANYSLVDLNRAGVPLMELVTEPDIQSGTQARKFCQELQLILRYLGVSDADMEKGQMRCEVNISISNPSRMISNESRMRPNESRIMLKDESYDLMGLLFEIHNKLGPIYKEKNYQDAIEEILKREAIIYEREKIIKLKFENLEISDFYADFIIDGRILLEVKAKPFLTPDDIRQTSRYIKSMNLPLGILVNFKRQKLEYKRIINPAFENDSSLFVENSRTVLGTKVEIKNLNSFRAVEKSIDYEIRRQTEELESGHKILQETRGWDDAAGNTFSQREKEEAHDYRYFPEPDLPPLTGLCALGRRLLAEMPELPAQKRRRLVDEYKLPVGDIEVLIQNKNLSDYFEEVCSEFGEVESAGKIGGEDAKKLCKLAVNYLITEIPRIAVAAKESEYKLAKKITSENFAEFIVLIFQGKISSSGAQAVLAEMFKTGVDPTHIIEEKDLDQISDESALISVVAEILDQNSSAIADFKNGKKNAIMFLVGKVMAATRGKANPQMVEEIIKKIILNL